MKQDYLKDVANALLVQKEQLNDTSSKMTEIDIALTDMQKEQKNHDMLLDNLLEDMEGLLQNTQRDVSNYAVGSNIVLLNQELELSEPKAIKLVGEVDKIEFDDNMSWDEYVRLIEEYSFAKNLDLTNDPFDCLMTKSQQIELQKRVKDEFAFKNANCDKYDYMIAGTCGAIGGLIDILFVGMPGDSKLGNITDEYANKITEKFAEFLGWDREKTLGKGSDTTASAIGFLEKMFKINYDQSTTKGEKNGTGGVVKNLSMKNHHLKSLGHSPDIIGLFFSILNQFTSTSTFISNGQIIAIDTKTFDLEGGNFIAKVFCGFANWFGHIMSDWTGSSGSIGRGAGVPIPFYNLLQMINIGRFEGQKTFAEITSKVFEEGYDSRHAMAMAMPVVVTELLVRFMYTMKAHFYHKKDWVDSIPKGSIPELRRMLLVGHGTICIMDGTHAAICSGGAIVKFLLRTNLIAWTRFGHLALKEVYVWHNVGHIDADAIDKYLDAEFNKMLKR